MQGVIQKYIDSSISSTVNLPKDTMVETVADIYMTAYKANLKGITVYREGSREGILITDDDKDSLVFLQFANDLLIPIILYFFDKRNHKI